MANSDWPNQSWIVLDTNFLIDFFSKQDAYIPILEKIRVDNTLVSIEPVRCEFIRSKTKDVVKLKSAFFWTIIETLLPLDKDVYSLVQPTIEQYGADIEKVSLTDIYLACVIQRYTKVYLLTRNHQDFPTKLFIRSYIFSVEFSKDVKTYALYQYKRGESKEIATSIVNIPF